MGNKIVIIGAGGHGKVVCDAIASQGAYIVVGFVDDTVEVGTAICKEYKVLATLADLKTQKYAADYFIVAIGNNVIRKKIYEELHTLLKPAVVIHASAIVSPDAVVSKGCVVLANAVVNTCCNIGENTIVNAGVVVDHDSIIGAHVHLSIGTMVGSNSEISGGVTTEIGQKVGSFSKIS